MTDPIDPSTPTGPAAAIDGQLRGNERRVDAVENDGSVLAVTDQRLLYAGPDATTVERSIELPNVETVEPTSVGGDRTRSWGIACLLLAPILYLGGRLPPWDDLLPASPLSAEEAAASESMGAGWAVDLITLVYDALALVDTTLVYAGLLALAAGVALLAITAIRRDRVLAVETTEGDPVHAPAFAGDADRVREAIATARSR